MNTQQPTSVGQGLSPSEQGFAVYQEVWQIIRRRKGRILLVMMLGLALATLYSAVSGPWYDANAQLLVIKKRLDTTPITGPDHVRVQEDYLSTHMLLITSRRVIARAIEKGDLQSLEQFQDKGGFRREIADWVSGSMLGAESEGRREEKLVTDIINALVVTRDAQKPGISPSNEVINLAFRGRVAADCPRVLDSIIASYQEFLKDTYRNTNAETLELIEQARVMVQKDLEVKEAAYQKFLADTPPLWRTQDRSTAHQDRLLRIDARLAALRMRRAEIEASIAIIEKAVQSGRNPTATVMRMSTTPGTGATAAPNPLVNQEPDFAQQRPGISLEAELVRLQLQQAKLLTIRPKNHPGVLALDGQMEAVRRMILPSFPNSRLGTGDHSEPAKGSAKDWDLGAIKLELLKQELDDLTVAEQALAKLFENEQKGVSGSYIHEIQDEAHRKGIERDRLLYESILNRLKETSTVKDFGGYNTQVIGPALRGTLAVKKYVLIFGLSLFCGLFGGFGWACLLEIAVKRSQSTCGLLMRNG
jgi:uncharacterized protein involved in exopolysaccharide biosynthesis